MTKMSGLTQMVKHMDEKEITRLGSGQFFGEGRFLAIYDRVNQGNSKLGMPSRTNEKLPTQLVSEKEN